jgi:DNA-binding transcriptional MerR regulator
MAAPLQTFREVAARPIDATGSHAADFLYADDTAAMILTVEYNSDILSLLYSKGNTMADYTITELSELSGVNRRNIHFYVQQGLLPPAEGAGLGARYTVEHLLRLRAIPVLRNRGLRLDEIRAQLMDMEASAVAALLAPPPATPASRALPHPVRPRPHAEAVTRYMLAPGVELLVGPDADHAWHAQIADLAEAIQRILYPHAATNPNGGHS